MKSHRIISFAKAVKRVLGATPARWISTILIIISLLPVSGSLEGPFNYFFLTVFSLEIALRTIVFLALDKDSPGRRRPELAFLIIDAVALLSFLPNTLLNVDTRFLRIFRLMRILKLLRNLSGTLREIFQIIESRSMGRQIRILVVIIMGVALAGSVVKALSVPEGAEGTPPGLSAESVFRGIWWCIRQMADPGNMLDLQEVSNFQHGLLSFTMMVFGVLVLSFVIGIGAEIIRELIETTRNRPIDVRNHYVLMGWNPQTQVLVRNLYAYLHDNGCQDEFRMVIMDREDREFRILSSIMEKESDAGDDQITVSAAPARASQNPRNGAAGPCNQANLPGAGGAAPTEPLPEDLEVHPEPTLDYEHHLKVGRNLFYRNGTPLSHGDLSIVNPQEARKVVILPRESTPGSADIDPDPEVISAILNVRSFLETSGKASDKAARAEEDAMADLFSTGPASESPSLVAILQNPDNCELAVTAGSDMALSKSDFISKFLSQLILNPWIGDIFAEIFSWEGSEIYTLDLRGQDFHHLRGKYVSLQKLAPELMERGIILLGGVRLRRRRDEMPISGASQRWEPIYERDMLFLNRMDFDSFSLVSGEVGHLPEEDSLWGTPERSRNCVLVELVYLAANRSANSLGEALEQSIGASSGDTQGQDIGMRYVSMKRPWKSGATLAKPEQPPGGGAGDQRVLILGWNNGVPLLISQLNAFLPRLQVTIMTDRGTSSSDRAACMSAICNAVRKKWICGQGSRRNSKASCGPQAQAPYSGDPGASGIFGPAPRNSGSGAGAGMPGVDTSGVRTPAVKFVDGNYTSAVELMTLADLNLPEQNFIMLVPEYGVGSNPDGKVFLGILNIMNLIAQGNLQLRAGVRIIAEVTDVNQGALMDRIVERFQERMTGSLGKGGATAGGVMAQRASDWLQIVPSENFFHRFLAAVLFDPQMKRIYDRLFTDRGEEIYILAPDQTGESGCRFFSFIDFEYGGLFGDLYLKMLEYGVIPMGKICGRRGTVIMNPRDADARINPGDYLVVVCSKDNPLKLKCGILK